MKRILCTIAAALLLGGCGAGIRVVEIYRIPVRDDPAHSVASVAVSVEDVRFAQAFPSPQAAKLIAHPRVKGRALGEWRKESGTSYDAEILPEGQSVADLFRDAVTDALRSCGYRVTHQDGGTAIPLAVRIKQFWISQTYLDRHEGRVSVLYGIPATEYDVATTVAFSADITGPLKPFENSQTFTQDLQGEDVHGSTATLAPAAIGTFRNEFRSRLRNAGASCGL